jgi:hypothetical protein
VSPDSGLPDPADCADMCRHYAENHARNDHERRLLRWAARYILAGLDLAHQLNRRGDPK